MGLKIALYQRCSTKRQHTQNQDLQLEKFAELHGHTIVERYVDSGYSGADDDRPALKLLLQHAKEGKFQGVAVVQISRFGRRLQSILSNIDILDSLNIAFFGVGENVDTSSDNPHGRLFLHLISCLMQAERELLVQRVKAGQARWRAQNPDSHFGRPVASVSIPRLLELKAQGMSVRNIAKNLCVSPATISRRLSEVRQIQDHPELAVSKGLA